MTGGWNAVPSVILRRRAERTAEPKPAVVDGILMLVDEDPCGSPNLASSGVVHSCLALIKVSSDLEVHGIAAHARITLAAEQDPRFVRRALEDRIRLDKWSKLAAPGIQQKRRVRAVGVAPDPRRLRHILITHHT